MKHSVYPCQLQEVGDGKTTATGRKRKKADVDEEDTTISRRTS